MGLPRVDNVLGFSANDADLAYSEARSAAAYLIEKHEMTAIRDIFKYMKRGKEFEEAFFLAVGVDYEVWQVEWIEYAENRYKFVMLLDIENLVWFVIVFLAIIVMTIAYIRRRMQMKRLLEEDEEDDDIDDDWQKWDTPYEDPIKPE